MLTEVVYNPVEITRNKTAASAAEDIFIPIPANCRNILYSYGVFTTAATVNQLDYWAIHRDANVNINLIGSVNIFNALPVTAAIVNASANVHAATHVRYRIQAAAGGATQFYLRIKFAAT